jgi:hypothetical protein
MATGETHHGAGGRQFYRGLSNADVTFELVGQFIAKWRRQSVLVGTHTGRSSASRPRAACPLLMTFLFR